MLLNFLNVTMSDVNHKIKFSENFQVIFDGGPLTNRSKIFILGKARLESFARKMD